MGKYRNNIDDVIDSIEGDIEDIRSDLEGISVNIEELSELLGQDEYDTCDATSMISDIEYGIKSVVEIVKTLKQNLF